LKDSKKYTSYKDVKLVTFVEKIEFRSLSFHYPNKPSKIFDKLDLEIKKGEKIGIIGRTGVGKSTLIDVLLGLLKPNIGSILVDGVEVHNNLDGWRGLIGYVPQKINVINGTIKDNILFGSNNMDKDAIEQRLTSSINLSEFEEVIQGSKNGLDTIVGDKGLDLSGGQLQRLAFARTLFQDPKILILDESTNALDPKTEKKIINNLLNFESNKTIIMISHNLETLNFCDSKYELKNLTLHKINE